MDIDPSLMKDMLGFFGISDGMSYVYFFVGVTLLGLVGLELFNLLFTTKYSKSWKELSLSSKSILSFLIGFFGFVVIFLLDLIVKTLFHSGGLQIPYLLFLVILSITGGCKLVAGNEAKKNEEIRIYSKTLAIFAAVFFLFIFILGAVVLIAQKQWLNLLLLIPLLLICLFFAFFSSNDFF